MASKRTAFRVILGLILGALLVTFLVKRAGPGTRDLANATVYYLQSRGFHRERPHPLQPREERTKEEAIRAGAYYLAKYDANGRLATFTSYKKSKEGDFRMDFGHEYVRDETGNITSVIRRKYTATGSLNREQQFSPEQGHMGLASDRNPRSTGGAPWLMLGDRVSSAQYEQLENGATYEEVIAELGDKPGDAIYLPSMQQPDKVVLNYRQEGGNGGYALIFEQGKLAQKLALDEAAQRTPIDSHPAVGRLLSH